MCGIAGIVDSRSARLAEPTSYLGQMADVLRHRGPDDDGMWFEATAVAAVGMVHRRLSIIDCSPTGHQPMSSACGRYILVFNGEVYNHRLIRQELESRGALVWRGTSDTEVLIEAIAAWGVDDTVRRLVGMFAFAVWDRKQLTLTLVRDRAGEKPLFYTNIGGVFAFASEVKALLVLPDISRHLNRKSLAAYLTYGYAPGELSMFTGICKLPPACIIQYNPVTRASRMTKYWELPIFTAVAQRASKDGINDYVEELRTLLEASVRVQLQADVPVAVLLSGGVDSSLIAAFAASAGNRIRTFTIGFPGHGVHDERPHARMVARHYGTDHVEIPLESTSLELVSQIAQRLDEPLCDSSILPTFLVARAVKERVSVVLGGDGGDELFGGYRAYNMARWQSVVRSMCPGFLRSAVAAGSRRLIPSGVPGRAYLAALDYGVAGAAARSLLIFDSQARRHLLQFGAVDTDFATEDLKENVVPEGLPVVHTATRMDFLTYLPDDLLVKVDRAAMMCSLEVRAPFLDHRLIEFAFGKVPDRLKAGWRCRKILTKELARRLLPPAFDIRRKQGFSVPLQSWLGRGQATPLHQAVRELPVELFSRKYIQCLFDQQSRGYNNSERIFCLALLSHWLRNYKVSF